MNVIFNIVMPTSHFHIAMHLLSYLIMETATCPLPHEVIYMYVGGDFIVICIAIDTVIFDNSSELTRIHPQVFHMIVPPCRFRSHHNQCTGSASVSTGCFSPKDRLRYMDLCGQDKGDNIRDIIITMATGNLTDDNLI